MSRGLLTAVVTLMVVGALKLGQALVLPIVIGMLLTLMLSAPVVVDRVSHLPVNTVAIFLGLLFFGWMWGIPGAVLAVPLTVCAKLVCDHVPTLAHVGDLLDT